MKWEFPYGRAPFCLLVVAIVTGIGVAFTHSGFKSERPDLVFATFARKHADVYQQVLPIFEERHGVKVEIQVVEYKSLQTRLQASLLAGTEVPDLVEIGNNMSYFTKGPVEDIGFVDLTDWVKENNLDKRMVESRFALWTKDDRIFALPHDVHPVMLVYRRDIVEDELGIDVSKIETWDDFIEMAHTVVKDLDGDGIPDRYAIELPTNLGWPIPLLLRQRGGGLFDKEGRVIFDNEIGVETVMWYVRQTKGEHKISFSFDEGQAFYRAMRDGLMLFFFAPDWRTRKFQVDAPSMEGKLALMPLPAWEKGGLRTSTHGATGLAITKACDNLELALKLAEFLYLKPEDLGDRFAELHIIPPLIEAWDMEVFDKPNKFFSNQPLGRLYADLAPTTPAEWVSPYTFKAEFKVLEAYVFSAKYYEEHGEEGFREFVEKELKRNADYVRGLMRRNAFLDTPEDV